MAKVTVKRNDLENLINESIKKYFDKINEISTDLKGAAAMRAAKKANDTNLPQWKQQKYRRQAVRLSRAAVKDAEKELGLTNGYFNPATGKMSGKFTARHNNSTADLNGAKNCPNSYYYGDNVEKMKPDDFFTYLDNKDLRRYGKAEDGLNNYADKWLSYHYDMNSELEENKTKKKELNESHIRAMVAETLKQVLSQRLNEEMDGWKLNPKDIQTVNSEDSGSHLYHIRMWWGSGYRTDNYQAYGFNEEDALCNVIAWIEQNNPDLLAHSDADAKSFKEELMQDRGMDEYEIEEDREFNEMFMYIDATMEGANSPHYIYSQNLGIQQVQ